MKRWLHTLLFLALALSAQAQLYVIAQGNALH